MGYLHSEEWDKINGLDQLPLGILSLFSNVIGTIGNALVLFVFLRQYTESTNYKIFVVCMAFQDFGTCIAHIFKETGKMLSGATLAGSTITCPLFRYMGNSVGTGAVVMALFITIERHRKICTPFKKQITLFQAKVMCALAFVNGGIMSIPMCFISGYRLVNLETLNVSRCSIKNEYDRDSLPISFLTIQAFLILFGVVFEAVILVRIRKRLEQQSKFKIEKAKSKTSNSVWVTQFTENLQIRSITNIQSEGNSRRSGRSTIESDVSIEQSQKLSGKGAEKTANPKVELCQTKQPTGKQSKTIDLENTKNRRIIRTLSVILLLLVISYFSFSVFQIYLCYNRYFFGEGLISRYWYMYLTMEYASDIVTINGILNPFVYFFTDLKFHAEGQRMFCRL